MAFKPFNTANSVPDSPDKLFLQLSRRKLPSVLPHQQTLMQDYVKNGLTEPDIAFQLPTGSGKTLVGLLIAEWRRRKFKEKIVYLCPTKQLVNQVALEAQTKYGISVASFTGSRRDYAPASKAEYLAAEKVAVTNYSSLFNSRPFFVDPDIIVLDDAHASENYIANMWSVAITRSNSEMVHLFDGIVGILRPSLEPGDYARLSSLEDNAIDASWVDKLPSAILAEYIDPIKNLIDEMLPDGNVKFNWSNIRNNLHACNLFLSTSELLIRPLIAPTWDHSAFSGAKQRIFMSATLGLGGDLERLSGRSPIKRLATPAGFEMQGVGRRFFMFPESSLDRAKATRLCLRMIQAAGRSLILVPSDEALQRFSKAITETIAFPILTAREIEVSKQPFISRAQCVMLAANRYDGIDFPHDECRLLIVEGLPKTTNLQERFLVSRMGANVLLADRIKTRIVQAIGRCTRSLEDYSAVIALGTGLPDYFLNPRNQKHLHPALQSEISFGSEQSKEIFEDDFIELFKAFLKHDAEWEVAEQQIVDAQADLEEVTLPCLEELAASAPHEISWQKKFWQGDYEDALSSAERVLGCLNSPELRGYRALWNYLAGSCAFFGGKEGAVGLEAKARVYFTAAKNAANGIPWLVDLSRLKVVDSGVENQGSDNSILKQVENIASILESLGAYHDKKFAKKEREILEGLSDPKTFENAHKSLGELLGFIAGKVESDGSPDPWWVVGKYCFVFEDYVGADAEAALGVNKARQAESHPNWVKSHVKEAEGTEIIPVLVSHIENIRTAALPHLMTTCFWRTAELRIAAALAISVVRELRTTFSQGDDLEWRAKAVAKLQEKQLDVISLARMFRNNLASKVLKAVP